MLRQPHCLQMCLLTMEEERWVRKAVARFESASDSSVRRTLLRVLALADHPTADAALQRVAADDAEEDRMLRTLAKGAVRRARPGPPDGAPTTSREQFEAMLAECVEKGRVPYSDEAQPAVDEALHHVRAEDERLLRQARRRIARRVSDESLLELAQVTTWLRRAISMPGDE